MQLSVCSIFAEDLCAHGIEAVKPDEVIVLQPGARHLIALPNDTEGRREAALALRLVPGGIECAIDWKAHSIITESLGYPEHESCEPSPSDELPPLISLADMMDIEAARGAQ